MSKRTIQRFTELQLIKDYQKVQHMAVGNDERDRSGAAMLNDTVKAPWNYIEFALEAQDREEELLNHVLMVMAWMHLPREYHRCEFCDSVMPDARTLVSTDDEFIKWVCSNDVVNVVRKYAREFHDC